MKKYFTLLLGVFLVTNSFCQDSKNISLLANWDPDTLPKSGGIHYNEIWGYVDCQGLEYAIMGSAGFVHFFNITDDNEFDEIAYFEGGNVTTWRDHKTYKNRSYSVCDGCSEGMMIFNLESLPDSVIKVKQTDEFFSKAHNIYIDEANGKLYAVGTNNQGDGVIILDIAEDPDNPTIWARHDLPGGYIHDLHVRNNIGYCSSGHDGLWVYDFSNPDTALVLGALTTYPNKGYNHAGWLSEDGNHFVFADESHNRSLKMTDVSDLSDIQVTDLFRSKLLAPADTASIAHNPFIRDNYVIASYYHDGVSIFDYSDPYNVKQIAWYDTEPDNTNYSGFKGCWGVYPYLPSGRLLASDVQRGMFIFSLDSIEFEPISPILAPELTINLSSDPQLCEGDSLIISSNAGAENYSWYRNDSLIQYGGLELNTKVSGQYYLAANNAHCISTSDLIDVEVFKYPSTEVLLSGDSKFCEGDSIQLSLDTGADSYEWYFSNLIIAADTNAISVFETGEYEVKVTSNGCSSFSDPIDINVIEYPEINLANSGNIELCEGSTFVLSAEGDAEDYLWYKDSILIQEGGLDLSIDEEGSYYLIAHNDICSSESESADFYAVPLPDATLTMTGLPWFCEGQFDEKLLTLPSGAENFYWYKSETLIGQNDDTLIINSPGNYYGLTQNGMNCFQISDTLVIPEFQLPEIEITSSTSTYCKGDTATLLATSGYNFYLWYQDSNLLIDELEAELQIQMEGEYSVAVTDGFCENQSVSFALTFHEAVIPEISFANDLISSTEASEYQWYLDGQLLIDETNQTLDPYLYFTGDYVVYTIDENGCEAMSEILFVFVSNTTEAPLSNQIDIFPNPFDGELSIKSNQTSDYQVIVYTSLGEKLIQKELSFSKNEIIELNISNLPSGTYFINFFDGKQSIVKRVIKQ